MGVNGVVSVSQWECGAAPSSCPASTPAGIGSAGGLAGIHRAVHGDTPAPPCHHAAAAGTAYKYRRRAPSPLPPQGSGLPALLQGKLNAPRVLRVNKVVDYVLGKMREQGLALRCVLHEEIITKGGVDVDVGASLSSS